jgi:hypothetical protein
MMTPVVGSHWHFHKTNYPSKSFQRYGMNAGIPGTSQFEPVCSLFPGWHRYAAGGTPDYDISEYFTRRAVSWRLKNLAAQDQGTEKDPFTP